jgi:regulator of sigma E protease
VILFAVLKIGGLQDSKPVVGETSKGSGAAKVLQKNDRIVAIDGHSYKDLSGDDRIEKFSELVRSHECAGEPTNGCASTTPVEVMIRRDGQLKTVDVTTHYNAKEGRMLMGIAWATDGQWSSVSAGESANRSLGIMGEVISKTGSVFSHIFEAEKRKEISSVVGISDVGHEAVNDGWRKAFLLLALVSLSLGLINLVPILPLDGGHIFWAIVEKLRGGKPVSIRVMERATIIGFALVLMLMVIGVSNDIGRLTGEGFNVSK